MKLDWRKDVIPAIGKKIKEILANAEKSGKTISRPQAMKQAWKDPAILKLIAEYRAQPKAPSKVKSKSSSAKPKSKVTKRKSRKVGGKVRRRRTTKTKVKRRRTGVKKRTRRTKK